MSVTDECKNWIISLNCVVQNRAVGIVLLVVILAALLILGCWYFKKRSGYKIIRVLTFSAYFLHPTDSGGPFNTFLFWFFCYIFCITCPKSFFSQWQTPRTGSPGYTGGQYSEAGPSAENKMALTDFGSFRPVVRDRKFPHGWLDRPSLVFFNIRRRASTNTQKWKTFGQNSIYTS